MKTTQDAFLGGALTLAQPRDGYRAGADPVFLAASIAACPGERVLDLGCGVGTALACLGRRLPGLSLTGVERDRDTADLARQNVAANGIPARIVAADVRDLGDLSSETFDHVLSNPPFFDRTGGSSAQSGHREAGRAETVPLSTWVATMLRRTRPGGWITLIQRAERLPCILSGCEGRAGDISVKPLAPRIGRNAKLILVRARKGGRGEFRLLPPLILHDGEAHLSDSDSYTAEVQAILRAGAPLKW